MSYIGPITKDILETCANELKKKENKDLIIKKVVEPIMSEIYNRYFLYILVIIIFHIVVIALLSYLVYKK